MMNYADVILPSVSKHIDALLPFLNRDQQRDFITYWKPMTETADIVALEKAAKTFRVRFCSKVDGLAAILPELNAPVADLGHPSIIAPGPVSEELLSFENKLILAEEVLRRFQQTVAEAEAATRQEDLPQAHADSAA